MILNNNELKLVGPALAMLEANNDAYVKVYVNTHGRVMKMEATSSGVLIVEQMEDSAPIMEFYAKAMGLAMAYNLKKLEDLLHPR